MSGGGGGRGSWEVVGERLGVGTVFEVGKRFSSEVGVGQGDVVGGMGELLSRVRGAVAECTGCVVGVSSEKAGIGRVEVDVF